MPRIGHGVSAEVFAAPDGTAVKLLHPGIAGGVAREHAASRLAHSAGLPVPAVFGETEIDGRAGLVFERLVERRWLRRLRRWPGAVLGTLAAMAGRQAAAHGVRVPPDSLPPARAVLGMRIAASLAPPAAVAAALEALEGLPDGDRLLHGDLHLGNVMNVRGGMRLIDWAQAMRGVAAADVARSELVMRYGRYGAGLRRWPALRAVRHAAARWYLWCYARAAGMDEAEVDAWRLPVAVAWWREGSAAHLPALAAYVEARTAR